MLCQAQISGMVIIQSKRKSKDLLHLYVIMPFCATRKTNPLYRAFRASIMQLYDYVAPPSQANLEVSPIHIDDENIHVKVNRPADMYTMGVVNYNFRKRSPVIYKA